MQRFGSGGSIWYRLTWKAAATPLGRLYCRLVASKRPTSDLACGSWPTPRVGTNGGYGSPQRAGNGSGGHRSNLIDNAQLATWATPTAEDGRRGGLPPRPHDTGIPLSQMAAWATPQARDEKGSRTGTALYSHNSRPLNEQTAMLVPGQILDGSGAETASTGQLNPAFSLWLMGYPAAWLWCAPEKAPRKKRDG